MGFVTWALGHQPGEPLFHNPRPHRLKRKTLPADTVAKELTETRAAATIQDPGARLRDGLGDPRRHPRPRPDRHGRQIRRIPARVTWPEMAKLPKIDLDRM
jgi:hypothetical protein